MFQVGLKSIDLNTNPQADGNIIFSNPEALTDPKAMKVKCPFYFLFLPLPCESKIVILLVPQIAEKLF